MATPWESGWPPKAFAEQKEADRTLRPTHPLNKTLNDTVPSSAQVNTISFNNDILLDWSRLGFTSARHVDLQDGKLPLGFTRHEVLGKSNSVVQRVEVLGTFLAMKTYEAKTEQRRDEVLAEISILRRLRHHHIIEYVGSMNLTNPDLPQSPTLSALFWPVAPCGLDRFFQEIDALAQAICNGVLDRSDMADLIRDPALGSAASLLRGIVYPGTERNKRTSRVDTILRAAIRRLFASFGCLAEALFYVHRQRVSHKDIKPSNILIYPNETTYQSTESNPQGETVKDGLRLTDFDGAKDLSQALETTVEDNWCTYAYASPETHIRGRSGRSADIFSMGCVYLEMLALSTIHPLLTTQADPGSAHYYSRGQLGFERGSKYLALHAKDGTLASLVAKVSESLPSRLAKQRKGAHRLQSIIESMLRFDPGSRPSADIVALRLSAADVLRQESLSSQDRTLSTYPLFGKCCARFALGVAESQQLLPDEEEVGGGAATPRTETPSPAPDRDLRSPTPPPYTPLTDGSSALPSVDGADGGDDHNEDQASEAGEPPAAAFTVPPLERANYTIAWNKYHQRLDPPTIEFNRADFDRIKRLDLCQYRYLMGVCQSVDTCKFNHKYRLSARDLDILRALKRQQVCQYWTKCTNSACFLGHNCPNMRIGTSLEDRTKTLSCCYGGPQVGGMGNCYFSKEMHDMDIEVAYRT